ncbi:uncharacterized protein LOC129599223 [Paramacrobiotus metropolitanus]|uniref:uncharacterized protein LOC129599223 n=1 Tax=Paramacrobiotus metropolitanus TaxID=2943436 RepID=UPI002445D5F1|nr:uncharacterized protein LOC129599223 [Paramacrobiotus metropolitanus]
MTITIVPEWYADLLRHLEIFFPDTLPLYNLVWGKFNKDLPWNGIEFVADRWPQPRVVLCRPLQEVLRCGRRGYACRQVCPYTITIWSSDDNILREMLQHHKTIEWDQEIMFHGLSCPSPLETVNAVCQNLGSTTGSDESWCTDVYELKSENLPVCSTDLPSGFVLTTLTQKYADQINSEWYYGGGTATREYLLDILDPNRKNYPSAAVVETASGRAVSYILYEAEGNFALGYTDPDYRNKGFFRIVNYSLAKTMFARGRKIIYVQVAADNDASRNTYMKLGGKRINNWKQHWLLYTPHSLNPQDTCYHVLNFVKASQSN